MENTKIGPRTIFTDGGQPMQVVLMVRASASAPSRLKCALVIPTTCEDGSTGVIPLPFAQPVVGAGGRKPNGYTPEFRMEMN